MLICQANGEENKKANAEENVRSALLMTYINNMIRTWLYHKALELSIKIFYDTIICNFSNNKQLQCYPTNPCPIPGDIIYDAQGEAYIVLEFGDEEVDDIWTWDQYTGQWVSDNEMWENSMNAELVEFLNEVKENL